MNFLVNWLSKFGISLCKIKRPVFIIGCGRSGTSLIARYISYNKDFGLCGYEKTDLFFPGYYPYDINNNNGVPPFIENPKMFSKMASKNINTDFIRNYFSNELFFRRKNRFLSKNVMIFMLLPIIRDMYKDSKFIHIVRDGRSVAYSYAVKNINKIKGKEDIYKKNGYLVNFNDILKKTSKLWNIEINNYNEFIKKYSLIENKDFIEIKYEDFCVNPEKVLKKIQTFTEVTDFDFQSIDFSKIKLIDFKYKKALSKDEITEITAIMADNLKIKKYI